MGGASIAGAATNSSHYSVPLGYGTACDGLTGYADDLCTICVLFQQDISTGCAAASKEFTMLPCEGDWNVSCAPYGLSPPAGWDTTATFTQLCPKVRGYHCEGPTT